MNRGARTILIIISMSLVVISAIVAWRFYQNFDAQRATNTSATNTTNISVTGYIPGADNDPALGKSTARVKIIAFEDFECPYCQAAEPTLIKMVNTYPNDVQFIYRDFPLYTIHPHATTAALAANCALEQDKFWEYHDIVYDNQSQLGTADIFITWAKQLGLDVAQFTRCLEEERYASEVQHDQDEGILAGVDSTPTYFVNGQKIMGVQSEATWNDIIQSFLK